MLATAASAIAGGACVVGGCWTHWRCLGRPPASWKLARAAFGGSLRPPHEDGCAPAARHLAFASGAALSGFALMESAFGHVGLNVVDGLHPLLPTIVGSGLLAGIGAQIARGSMLTHIMQCGFQSSGRRESAVSAITAGAAAVGTSLVGHLNPDLFFVDPSAARHSMDAAIMFDGSSMVAFTAAGLLFIALRQHGFTKSNVIPVLGAFSSGALVGLGCGLMGLTNAQNIAALTSLSSAADPSVLLGVATAVAGNVFIMPRIKRLPDDSSAFNAIRHRDGTDRDSPDCCISKP
ncbi:unnamed protein product (mitochondrion) [Plasmodiophora brassicae]|uniref:Uncharacterized protein n=1 Tax=Plasmodiophora brassicae TaxID=37360 RepID=A0A3P3YIR8_PLABS|nr:unnamed protein product [Plasmodiophora brassicae]